MTTPAPRILACRIAVPETRTAAARDAHPQGLAARIAATAEPGAHDRIIPPERLAIAYSDAAFDRRAPLKEPLDGPSVRRFSDLARRLPATILSGFSPRDETDRQMAQAAIDLGGRRLGRSAKIHIAQFAGSIRRPAHADPETPEQALDRAKTVWRPSLPNGVLGRLAADLPCLRDRRADDADPPTIPSALESRHG